MRTRPVRGIAIVVTAVWLGAGPGTLALRGGLCCPMQAAHAPGEQGHHHHAPCSGPCLCCQCHVSGPFDAAAPDAMPALATTGAAVQAPVLTTPEPAGFRLPVSPPPAPETPPPIVA
jgi:hypothetical protein